MTDSTRRSFLAAGAVAAAPFFIKADNKSGTKLPIVGEGDYTYEWIDNWGDLPANIKYGNTHSVCEDAQGHIYIHHTVHKDSPSPDSVVVFDNKGKFVRSWGAMFRGGAHGMQYSKEGREEYFYFCDEKHGIVTKRTLKGEEVWTMGYPQDSKPYEKGPGKPGLNFRPTNIALAPNGDFWFGDGYGSYYMFHYSGGRSAYPKLLNTFGGPPPGQAQGRGRGQGPAPGAPPAQGQGLAQTQAAGAGRGRGRGPRPPAPLDSTNNPHGNFVDLRDPANPILLIADRGNRRIVRYTLDDKPIDIVEGTRSPCHFHERKGMIVVPDLQSRVTLFDKDNKVVAQLGEGKYEGGTGKLRTTEDRSQFEPGKFITPHGAIFDHTGNLFIVEWVEIGRVTKLRKVAA